MKTFQNLYIKLNNDSIESFIEKITQNCNENWQRDFEREENAKYFREKAFSFKYTGKNELPSAGLTLFENENAVWYVPNIIPIEMKELSIDEYNKLLVDFKKTLIEPAIQNTTITITITKDEVSLDDFIDQKAVDALKRFSSLANKSTGNSHPNDKNRWFEFLVAAQKSEKKPSFEMLKATLIEQGWSEEFAYDLAFEFEHGQELLDFVKKTDPIKNGA
jgi:hypothetical protein